MRNIEKTRIGFYIGHWQLEFVLCVSFPYETSGGSKQIKDSGVSFTVVLNFASE